MTDKIDTRVIQVTNIAPNVQKDQMKTLFNYLGRIDEIKLYPSECVYIYVFPISSKKILILSS